MKNLPIFFLAFILLNACSSVPSNVLNDSEKLSLRREVADVMTEFQNVLRANHHNKISDFFSTSGDFQFALSNANELLTPVAFDEILQEVFPLIEKQEFETISQTYTVISRDVVICAWHGKNETHWKDGRIDMYDDYWSTFVFKRMDGAWKIVYGHESVFMPEAQVFPEPAL